ncbi:MULTISPECIES: ABC transporter ATP-binding protein [unclassified Chelatococcus]|uniref:ABC transporter ATP-binding protein n=1 Tax=unclassified Chelatococcus TaxID=2638111 RepID=UPI001BCACF42|nr:MULTISPECIES: ABC transporter ATP-binding protein [unclassified Chelatococcus]MBS7700245.1 ABC transporter ATP-binding protein [Chelatococcus sp. YT9]MBX3558216.1 ABC transporter ATP-binding protein [Chelatococcus sp.]
MLLDIRNVQFGYQNETRLLQGFDLHVARGEFVALLGPSGCGKSTLMNLAAGLLQPLGGEVDFDSEPLNGLNREVGYMTQGDTLLPWATVAKNITLPLELRKISRAEREERLDKVIRLVNLSGARDKFPSELSGGMKRRALLARSIVYDPQMLLMDEPFGALDAQLREVMHQELLNTVARTGQSVLFVTHDISEAILLADRVLVLGGLPLRVMEEINIPWGKDRILSQIRSLPAYSELELRLRELLRAADAASKAQKH